MQYQHSRSAVHPPQTEFTETRPPAQGVAAPRCRASSQLNLFFLIKISGTITVGKENQGRGILSPESWVLASDYLILDSVLDYLISWFLFLKEHNITGWCDVETLRRSDAQVSDGDVRDFDFFFLPLRFSESFLNSGFDWPASGWNIWSLAWSPNSSHQYRVLDQARMEHVGDLTRGGSNSNSRRKGSWFCVIMTMKGTHPSNFIFQTADNGVVRE